jgi:hypothetical protein
VVATWPGRVDGGAVSEPDKPVPEELDATAAEVLDEYLDELLLAAAALLAVGLASGVAVVGAIVAGPGFIAGAAPSGAPRRRTAPAGWYS